MTVPRDAISLQLEHIERLEAHVERLERLARDRKASAQAREQVASDAARAREALDKAVDELVAIRVREVNSRIERIRRPAWKVSPAVQMDLLTRSDDTATPCAGCGQRYFSVRWRGKEQRNRCEACAAPPPPSW